MSEFSKDAEYIALIYTSNEQPEIKFLNNFIYNSTQNKKLRQICNKIYEICMAKKKKHIKNKKVIKVTI